MHARWWLNNIKAPTPTGTARNDAVGDHFAPREVIRLMASILFIQDDKLLATPATVRKLMDPVFGTGGMLAEPQSYLRNHHGDVWLYKLVTTAVTGQIDVAIAA